MVGLPDGEKTLRICVTVYTRCRRVTDRQTDILLRHSSRYAYASRSKNWFSGFAFFRCFGHWHDWLINLYTQAAIMIPILYKRARQKKFFKIVLLHIRHAWVSQIRPRVGSCRVGSGSTPLAVQFFCKFSAALVKTKRFNILVFSDWCPETLRGLYRSAKQESCTGCEFAALNTEESRQENFVFDGK